MTSAPVLQERVPSLDDTPARVQFEDEQTRRRRGTWRATAACLIAASIAGVFLSIVLLLAAPAFFGVFAGLVVRLIAAAGLSDAAIHAAYRVLDGPNRNAALAALAAVLVLPTLLPPPLIWLWMRSLALRPREAPWPAPLGVRPPHVGVPEERQFVNLAGEIAVAAGLPTPDIGIIDAVQPNMAAFGTGHDAAGIVVTTELLARLDRAETQMLAAQLVGAIGNGDLHATASLLAVYRAIAFVLAATALPISRRARRAVAATIRATLGGDAARRDAALCTLDAQLAARGLGRALIWLPVSVIALSSIASLAFGHAAAWGKQAMAAALLLGVAVLAYGLIRLTLGVWTLAVLRWPLALVARRRRFMADATAVQLAGDPGAMARALVLLAPHAGIPAGSGLWRSAFVVPSNDDAPTPLDALEPTIAARVARLQALGAGSDTIPALPPARSSVRLGIGGVALFFLVVNWRFTLLLLGLVAGGLLTMSAAAGVILFGFIVNA